MSGALNGAITGVAAFAALRNLLGSGANCGPRLIMYQPVNQNSQGMVDQDGNPIYVAFNTFVSIMESHHDEMQITDHPVEQGVVISDHAFRMPSMLRMRMGWSPSAPGTSGNLSVFGITLPTFSGLLGISDGAGAAYVQSIYSNLLAVMAARSLMVIVTGKRTYNNMLLAAVDEETTEQTENALIINATFREIILVSTSTVQIPVNPAAQAYPQQTSPTTNAGPKNLQPAPNFNPSAVPPT